MAALTTRAALVSRAGGEQMLLSYAKNDEALITRAINIGSERAISALKNTFDSATIDALTSATAPEEVRYHVENMAMDFLTSWDGARPESITKDAEAARDWLKFAAGGSVNLDLLRIGETSAGISGRGDVSWRSPVILDSDGIPDEDFYPTF